MKTRRGRSIAEDCRGSKTQSSVRNVCLHRFVFFPVIRERMRIFCFVNSWKSCMNKRMEKGIKGSLINGDEKGTTTHSYSLDSQQDLGFVDNSFLHLSPSLKCILNLDSFSLQHLQIFDSFILVCIPFRFKFDQKCEICFIFLVF